MPVGAGAGRVASGLPGADGRIHLVSTGEALAQALAGEDAQFDLRHVEPAAVLRCMHQPQAASQPTGGLGIEGVIQAGDVVRVEVVAHQRDTLRIGIVLIQQVSEESSSR